MRLVKFKINKREILILIAFLLLVSFLRISSFFKSAIDADESLYFMMAREMLDGQILYTGIWDHKPPGIFGVFALIQLLLGDTIFAMRLATSIAVTITCYLLYRLGTVIGKNDSRFGLLAAVLYAVYSLNLGGLAANTEIFFTPLVVLAFYLFFTSNAYPAKLIGSNGLRFFIIGLLFGLGLQINYVVLFPFIAVLLITGGALFLNRESIRGFLGQMLTSYALLGGGLILPLLFIILYFTLVGHFDDYLYSAFIANTIYTGDQRLSLIQIISRLRGRIEAYLFLWICLFLILPYLFFFRNIAQKDKKHLVFLLIWALLACVGIGFTGRFYNHYFLQVLPVLCLISAYIILSLVGLSGLDTAKQYFILALILLHPFISVVYPHLQAGGQIVYNRYVKGLENWGDNPAIVSQYLRERVNSDDYIFVVDYQFIIWYLVPSKIPTRYVFSPYFRIEPDAKMARVDPTRELESIMSKKPVYIIKTPYYEDSPFYVELNEYLENDYVLEKSFPNIDSFGVVQLYRSKT